MSKQIQWYPGHMHKASKEIRTVLSQVDVFVELLDARIPFSSENPMLASIRDSKPCLKVITKTDLADNEKTMVWKAHLESRNATHAITVNLKNSYEGREIPGICKKIYQGHGGNHLPFTAMVVGIPNVGKSTLINVLTGRPIAKTGNEPAVTRMQQRIRLSDDMILLDTPGVLWPNVENPHSGMRLAITGAIRDTAITHEDVASYAAAFLLENYPNVLQERYAMDVLPENDHEFLQLLGRKRGCLKSGGKVDMDRVAKLLLGELREGTLGGVTFETPQMMVREQQLVMIRREEKAAKKLARKQKFKGR